MRRFIGINRDVIVFESLTIRVKVLARRRTFYNVIWGIIRQTEDAAKSLVGSILMTKIVRLHTEYIAARKVKMTLHGVPIDISEDIWVFLFSQFGEGCGCCID